MEIQAFEPEPYSEVWADFGVQSGVYSGRWIDRDWKKNDNPHSRAERIWDSALATVIRDRCRGKSGTVTEEKKPVTTIAPLLYDLTSSRGRPPTATAFPPKGRSSGQECYEKHKVLTYPRTDSRYLPEDYLGKVYGIVGAVAEENAEFAPLPETFWTTSG